jgi:hypothetical protein
VEICGPESRYYTSKARSILNYMISTLAVTN